MMLALSAGALKCFHYKKPLNPYLDMFFFSFSDKCIVSHQVCALLDSFKCCIAILLISLLSSYKYLFINEILAKKYIIYQDRVLDMFYLKSKHYLKCILM
jgi:hypothetical protein